MEIYIFCAVTKHKIYVRSSWVSAIGKFDCKMSVVKWMKFINLISQYWSELLYMITSVI